MLLYDNFLGVSYGPGTRNGPGAILEASHYVELYDDELDEEVYRIGVHTLPSWLPEDMEPASCLADLEKAPDFMTAKLCYKLLGYAFFPEKARNPILSPR